jgi:hypothetical protein
VSGANVSRATISKTTSVSTNTPIRRAKRAD